jgi:hypothetical protein
MSISTKLKADYVAAAAKEYIADMRRNRARKDLPSAVIKTQLVNAGITLADMIALDKEVDHVAHAKLYPVYVRLEDKTRPGKSARRGKGKVKS